MRLSNTEEIVESEHFKAVICTSLGLNGWILEIKRKNDKEGYLYFTRRDKDEIVELLGSIPSIIKKVIEDYERAIGEEPAPCKCPKCGKTSFSFVNPTDSRCDGCGQIMRGGS